MKVILKVIVLLFLMNTAATQLFGQSSKYKCMIQLNAYTGEKAYIVISLIGPKGDYQKTLYLIGKEKKWYNTLKEWFKFFAKTNQINARTGASVAGGDRTMIVLDIEDKNVDKGYKLRFETAVEDQKYYTDDVEIPLSSEALTAKTEGKGYVKYIRFSKVQP